MRSQIAIVDPVQIHYDRSLYAGAHQGSRLIHFSVTPLSVFNTPHWSIIGSLRDCSFVDVAAGTLLVGSQTGPITIRVENYRGGLPTGAAFEGDVTILAEPQISFNRPLMVGNDAQAMLTDYGAFQSLEWSIPSRTGAADTTIDAASGLVTVGLATGTVTVRAKDPNDNYYVETTVPVYPEVSIHFSCPWLVSEGPQCTATVLNWHYPQPATWSIVGWNNDPDAFATIDRNTGVLTPLFMDHRKMITEQQLVIQATAANGDFIQDIISIYLRPVILGSPTCYLIADNGGWMTTAYVWPLTPVFPGVNHWELPVSLPGVTLTTLGGQMRAGLSTGPVVVRAVGPSGQTLDQVMYVIPPPQLGFSKPFLIADNSSQVVVSELEADTIFSIFQPVFAGCADPLFLYLPRGNLPPALDLIPTFPVLESCPSVAWWPVWSVLAQGTGTSITPSPLQSNQGLITPGLIPAAGDPPVTITVRAATRVFNPGYTLGVSLQVRAKPTIQFTKPSLPADGSQATASVSDITIFPTVTWAIIADAGGTGSTISSSGLITAGGREGTITIRATAAGGAYSGYQIQRDLVISSIPTIQFTRSSLPADGQSQSTATVTDPTVFPSVTWAISNPGTATDTSINASGLITAGTRLGTITVRATAASGPFLGYYVEKTLGIRAIPTVQFSKPALPADGVSRCFATVSDPQLFPGLTWLITGGGGTGTTINSDGELTAGRQTGTVTVRATAGNGYSIQGTLEIRAVPPIQFSKASLPANSPLHSTASISDPVLFPSVTWSVSADPDGTASSISGGAGVITAGSRTGIITIRATAPNGYYVESPFPINSATIAFDVDKLTADGKSKCWASLVPAGAMVSPVWSIQAPDLKCKIDATTGRITAGTTAGKIVVRATESGNSSYYAEARLRLADLCLDNCATGNCAGGGGVANDNSVDVAMSLGYAGYGDRQVALRIKESLPSAALVTPAALWVAGIGPDVELIPPSGTLQQVRSPVMLAMVADQTSASYKIKFYSNNQLADNPSPVSGSLAHQSAIFGGIHQHYFLNATARLTVNAGDTLIAYVYLDPANPPSEVMLQWNDGSWEHRAYWGANNIGFGADNTDGRRYLGALPPVGQWIRLEVPASNVGLEGHTLNGMAFTLYGGRVTWDFAGKSNAGTDTGWVEDALPAGATPYADGDTWLWIAGHTAGTAYSVISGQLPFCTWTIENPTPGNYNLVRVTEARGGATYVSDYSYSSDANGTGWDMVVDAGRRKERRKRLNAVETYSVLDALAGDALLYQETRTYQKFAWNAPAVPDDEELVSLTIGTGPNALSTSWSYYTDPADTANYRHIATVQGPSGSWETYKYDSQGRKTRVVSQFLDNPVPTSTAEENNNKVKTLGYDDLNQIVEELVLLNGVEMSHRYTVRSTEAGDEVIKEVRCQDRGVTTLADSRNLVTKTKTFPAGSPFEYQTHSIERPDGTMLAYSYSALGGIRTLITKEGQPNAPRTDVIDGVKTVKVVDRAGNVRLDQQFDILNGSLPLSSKTTSSWDLFGRPLTYIYGDASFETMTYSCCGLDTIIDRSGVLSQYGYDGMKRVSSVTKAGVTIQSLYNPLGKLQSETRITPDGGGSISKLLRSYTYDTAGRLSQSTDLIGTTTFGITTVSGHKVVTTTFPNNSTRIENYFQDGNRFSIAGSAVYPSNYEYGTDADGFFQKEIRVRGASTAEWTKHYVDLLNRPSKTIYPVNALGQTPYLQNDYRAATGQLWKQRDADGVLTLFAYNARGELYRRATDIDRDGLINPEVDRVEEYSNTVQPQGAGMLAVKHTYVWDKDSAAPAVPTERLTEAVAVDGSYTSSTAFGQTTARTISYDRASRKRTETETRPDNTQRISVFVDDRPDSLTMMDAASPRVQLSQVTYQYFTGGAAYGFLQNAVDARNGTTSYTYDAADRIASITTPVPGFGQTTPLVSRYAYDETNPQGRVETTTLPDLTTVSRTYRLTGELKRTSGAGVIPSEYDYEQGRVKSIKTWGTYPNETTARLTVFNYSADRGFLESKSFAGSPGPSFTYYDSGRTKTRTWQNGTITSYAYNNAGDLWQVDYSTTAANPDVTYSYTSRGQTKVVTETIGGQPVTHTAAYYTYGLPAIEATTGGPLDGVVVEYNYDGILRRQSAVVRKMGAEVYRQTYAYHAADSLIQNITFDGVLAHYDYENNAPLVQGITLKQGSEAGATILTSSKQHNYLNQLYRTSTTGVGSMVSFTSQFNALSKRQRVTLQDGSYWLYTYDSHGQLKSAKKYWSDDSAVGGQQFEYVFDDVGNRLDVKTGGETTGIPLRESPYIPNTRNQYDSRNAVGFANVLGSANSLATVTAGDVRALRRSDYFWAEVPLDNSAGGLTRDVTVRGVRWNGSQDIVTELTKRVVVPPAHEVFQYDSDGNLLTDGFFTYSWDVENQLIKVEESGTTRKRFLFDYDFLGRRVQKTVQSTSNNGLSWSTVGSTRYAFDGWNQLIEFDGTGALVRSYAWGPTDRGSIDNAGATAPLLVKAFSNGQIPVAGTFYLASDVAGNTVALYATANGTQAALYEYGPFGEALRATGAAAEDCLFRFAGKHWDSDTRLVYYGYRFLSPSLGRWLGRDPAGEAGGVNLYGFAGNDPVNQQDWLGLAFDDSSSFWQLYEGQSWDPALLAQNYLSYEWGVLQGLPRGVKGGLEGLGRTLIHPIDTAEALLAVPRLISSGLLKCLLEQKWNEFAAGSWEERGMMVGEVIGNFAIGIIADKGIGELFQILRAGSKLSAAGKIANAAEIAVAKAPQQIAFGSDMSSWAQTLRYTTKNWNPAGNVSVFEYTDAAGNLQYSMGYAQRMVGHAEQIVGQDLISQGINPSSVLRVYTEFAPCNGPANCSRYIQQTFPNADVFYSFTHDAAGRAAKAATFSTFP
ncbi:MAG TPA: RHS repeat-associated core domain-containing protein [Methylomirabilota bacterium]|nr:RHS repeat-associated core domain-containing protein [Methylomirabilota bacterium]